MLYVAMGLLVPIANLQAVDCYVDTRGLPCANKKMLDLIPSEYVTWDGSIDIEMNCAAGHDMPLTTPDYNVFQCKPDGSSWNPPIFADCNKKILPKTMFVRLGATLSSAHCGEFSISKLNNNGVALTWNSNTSNVILCPQESAIGRCRVDIAKTVCDLQKHFNEESVLDLGLVQPHVFIRAQFQYTPSLMGTSVDTSLTLVKSELAQKFEQLTGSRSEVSSRLKLTCPKATVGVITESDRFACRGCPLGHYLDPMMSRCQLCAAGYYNDEPLQIECKICPSMRGIANTTIWKIVKRKVKDGSHAVVLCPRMRKDENGNLDVYVSPVEEPKPREEHFQAFSKDSAAPLLTPLTTAMCCLVSLVFTKPFD